MWTGLGKTVAPLARVGLGQQPAGAWLQYSPASAKTGDGSSTLSTYRHRQDPVLEVGLVGELGDSSARLKLLLLTTRAGAGGTLGQTRLYPPMAGVGMGEAQAGTGYYTVDMCNI